MLTDQERLITEISNALRGSVPKHVHETTLKALQRCHDLMARSLPHIRHKEIYSEMAIYGNILEQYFYNGELEYYPTSADLWMSTPLSVRQEDLKNVLRKKGINIPSDLVKRAKTLKETAKAIDVIDQITKKKRSRTKPAPKRGRPKSR